MLVLVVVVGGVGLACFQHKMCWEQNTHTGLVLPSERHQPSWPPPSGAVCRGESRAWLDGWGLGWGMCCFLPIQPLARLCDCFRVDGGILLFQDMVAFGKLSVTWIPQEYM